MTTSVKINTIILSILLGGTLFLLPSERAYSMQNSVPWSPLKRIPGYLDDTFPPIMVADQNKTVHAFVSQWVGEETPLKAIVYRQWSANIGWAAPVDILLPPNGETEVYSAFLDKSGTMHLLFRAGEATGSSVYYSSAFVEDMDRATGWSEPEIIGENAMFPGSGSIVGDEYGNLTVIYNGTRDGNGVYAVHSHDSGQSWSDVKPIFLTYDPQLTPFSLQSIYGSDNRGHAVWNVLTNTGVDSSLYYANFNFENSDWNTPVILDERIEKEDFF
ncbi:MAG: hypothetical protein IAF02_25445, partial [Anaerolineae bacterium]|nr:hypothetical protein [Anaerolineae bacterium]